MCNSYPCKINEKRKKRECVWMNVAMLRDDAPRSCPAVAEGWKPLREVCLRDRCLRRKWTIIRPWCTKPQGYDITVIWTDSPPPGTRGGESSLAESAPRMSGRDLEIKCSRSFRYYPDKGKRGEGVEGERGERGRTISSDRTQIREKKLLLIVERWWRRRIAAIIDRDQSRIQILLCVYIYMCVWPLL